MREPVGLLIKRACVVLGGALLAALVYTANNIEAPNTAEQAGYNAGTFGLYALCVWIILRGLGIRLFKSAPVILACLLTGCGVTPTTPSPSGGSASAADLAFCVTETNRLRATRGLPALAQASDLEAFGALAAENDHKSGVPHQYFKDHASGAMAENQVNRWPVASGVRATMQQAITAYWSEGPGGGHYENIVGGYRQLGCGVFRTSSTLTFVQEFRR